jgi:hypothetical protein
LRSLSGYLDDVERFGQTSYATPTRLETKITARARPTSFARFATSGAIGSGRSDGARQGRPDPSI